MTRRSTSLFQVAAALFVLSTVLSGQDRRPSRQPSTALGDWPYYTADVRGTKYSPLGSGQRIEFQESRGGVAVQDRYARSAP